MRNASFEVLFCWCNDQSVSARFLLYFNSIMACARVIRPINLQVLRSDSVQKLCCLISPITTECQGYNLFWIICKPRKIRVLNDDQENVKNTQKVREPRIIRVNEEGKIFTMIFIVSCHTTLCWRNWSSAMAKTSDMLHAVRWSWIQLGFDLGSQFFMDLLQKC